MRFEEHLEQIELDIKVGAKKYNIYPLEWEDIAQELRIQLWKKFSQFNPRKATFRTWARRVMNNKIIDLARHYNALKRGGDGRKLTLSEIVKEDELPDF